MDLRTLKSYVFGPFRLDLETGYLYRPDGQKVELTATPRRILEHMLENTNEDEGGRLFTRERIIGAVWGNVAVESATLDKHIGALRKAFGVNDDQSVIETKHREGYRFKLPVSRVYGADVEPQENLAGSPVARDAALVEPIADTFGLWLFSRRGGTLLFPILVLVVATVAASIYNRKFPTLAQTIASVGQCLIIFGLFLHSLRNRPKGLSLNKSSAELTEAGYNGREEYAAEEPILQKRLRLFTKWWSAMLASWVALYVVYAWETWSLDRFAASTNEVASVLEAVFNIVNTAMVILCYNVLNQEPGRQRRSSSVFTAPAAIGIALLVFIPLLSQSRSLTPQQGLAALTLLTGLYAGVYMALFVARLQSKFLDPAPLLVVLLFSYTAIQPLALYIQNSKEWAWAVLDYALVLKCLLYLYVFWLIESGDLLFYFREVKRNYDDRVDQRRRAHRRLLQ
ncbi:MAG TPA: winged helix-turn-helix domain-containing protein [Pyrinomonadaceae bacterium]|nr:winged helix-turn-helix domain-containing protein [Pyrinomonadaceae bacterium]